MPIKQAILDNLQRANNILLLTHINPDGDTIGCVAAFYHLAKLLNTQKQISISATEEFWKNTKYSELNLAQCEFLTTISAEGIKKFDLIIACDCGEITRTNFETILLQRACPLISIDHHKDNSAFGDINIIDEQAAATTEIVYKLFKETNAPINKIIADCLLLGIITDTDCFSTLTTTRETLKIADELTKLGANLAELNKTLWQNKTPHSLKYWAQIFSRIKINKQYKVAIITIPDELMKEIQENDPEIAREITEFLNYLSGVKMAIILKHDKDNRIIKGSARTTSNSVDVGLLASIINGGGHQKAAGFSVSGELISTDNGYAII
jgi:phosphoesterase RecJ-like protein